MPDPEDAPSSDMSQSALLPTDGAIKAAVAARCDWGLAALQQLIAVDSVAPNEAVCQVRLAELLHESGLPAQLIYPDAEVLRRTNGFIEVGLPLENRPNLVVALGGDRAGERGQGRSLVLNSHIDTVTWREEAERWRTPPLVATIRDGNVYGRGAVDAKGQLLAALVAVLALRDLGYEPGGSLLIQSVLEEEPSGNGTLALCTERWLADAAIVLEPTANQVAYGHRGIIGLRFDVAGQAGHGAFQHKRANAIVSAGKLAGLLDQAVDGWCDPADAVYGLPTLTVARIGGGEEIFSAPSHCWVECGVRYAPGTGEALLRHIRQAVQAEARRQELPLVLDGPAGTVFSHYDAAETPPDAPLVTTLLDCVQMVTPDRQLVVFPGGCDARHFVNRGSIPTVIFGPGHLSAAHAVDEHLPIDQWLQAARALALFIVRWCG